MSATAGFAFALDVGSIGNLCAQRYRERSNLTNAAALRSP